MNDGRLKFSKGKVPMKIYYNPLQVEKASYVEPMETNMAEIIKDFDMEVKDGAFRGSENQIEVVCPKVGECLLDFLHRCKDKDS